MPQSGWPNFVAVRTAVIGAAVLLIFLAAITVEMFLMLQEMRQLGSALPNSAPSVNRLDAIRADLDRMQPDLHQVNEHLNQVQGNTTGLDSSLQQLAAEMATLDKDLQQVKSDLKDIDQHVANIDRKTGPAPPVSVP
jgi:septal ring factor EnvC (AmiA/AmiB activator)